MGTIVLQPIFKLQTGMKHIMDGNLNFSVSFNSNDELYQLGVAYNYMRLGLIEASVLKDKLLHNAEREAVRLADIIAKREVVYQNVDQSQIVYKSEVMHQVIQNVKEAASLQQPVLITGETGVVLILRTIIFNN